MKILPALGTFCALALPCALLADTFEGKIGIAISSPSSGQGTQTMNLSVKEGLTRFDIASPHGTMSMIRDSKNQQMIILMAQQRMYMVQPIPQSGYSPAAQPAAPAHGATLKETGEKETILGYLCTKYTESGPDGSTELWVTDQLGTFAGLPQSGGPMARRPQTPPPSWEAAIKGRGFFPMRVVSSSSKGTFRFEVTSVEKTSLPDSLFSPPDGWRKFDMGAMMGGAMPGGFPGSRPTGGDN